MYKKCIEVLLMDNILDLNGKRIEEIEREAYNKFMAVKIDEDRYIFPANIVNTEAIDANFKKSDLFNDLALVKKVKSMDFSKSNSVIITCADKYEDGTNVVELVDTKEIDNEGKNAEAEKLFKAAGNNANLAIVDVLNGNYKAAAAKVAGATDYNAALIALLNGNTAPAAALKCECAPAAYLRAIAAARNGDAAGVKKNLETAKKCEKLAARAAKDIEFAQYR